MFFQLNEDAEECIQVKSEEEMNRTQKDTDKTEDKTIAKTNYTPPKVWKTKIVSQCLY